MTPTNAIEAVTHPDPYPYYDELATRPLWWDDALDIWVAARPDDVRAALGHPAARVRPLDVPVPAGLVGTESGDVFGRLVRMHDRDDRMVVKDAITAALASLDTDQVADAVAASATWVSPIDGRTGRFVDRWIADVPLGAVAALLGVDGVDLSAAVEAGHSVAASFGPTRPADAADRAARAVEVLTGLATTAAIGSSGLAAELCRTLPANRADEALANTIGLLFQTADATAGLCGNTLARLAGGREPERGELAAVVADVAVNDPAVHNTRRWFIESADIAGATVGAGEAVLVVLAAANRAARDSLSFGSGRHRCPAADLAPRIAASTIEGLLEEWPGVLGDSRPTGYRPLPNARIPVFG